MVYAGFITRRSACQSLVTRPTSVGGRFSYPFLAQLYPCSLKEVRLICRLIVGDSGQEVHFGGAAAYDCSFSVCSPQLQHLKS